MNLASEEQWRPIPGWEGAYEASDLGRIRSVDRWVQFKDGRLRLYPGRILQGTPLPTGHLNVKLSVSRQRETTRIHSLVMLAFVGPRPDELQVRHLNGDPTDNRLTNLVYGTHSQNTHDAVAHGAHNQARKTHCKHGHPYDEANTAPRPGRQGRVCRTCHRAAALKWKYNQALRAAGMAPQQNP